MMVTSLRRVLVGLCLAALAATVLGAGVAQAQEFVARVSGLRGVLEASSGDASGPWTPLGAGSLLKDRQRLRTGPASRAEIAFDAGEQLVIGPESEIVLQVRAKRSSLSRLVSVWLSQGVAEALFGEPTGGSFRVGTDLVIAAARSTHWIVERNPGAAAVFVEEGHVAVDPASGVAGAPVVLAEGEGVEVNRADGLSVVKQWGEARVQALKARLQPQ